MMRKCPNILLITSDQQHWNTIGKHFSEINTPNLDRLAGSGMLFQRAYCPNPTCTPSRASILTGQYPSRHGAWSIGTKLPEDTTTIGDLLRDAGYDASLIGKAHFQPLANTEDYSSFESYPILKDLDFWRTFKDPYYGFNHVEMARNHGDQAHVGQHYAIWMEEKGFDDWQDHFQNKWRSFDASNGAPNPPQKHTWTIPEEYHYNTWITERAIARMDHCAEQSQPFFLWASYIDPHPPYLVPEPWATMYDPNEITVPEVHPEEHAKNPPHFQKTQDANPDFTYLEEGGQANHGLHSHLRDETSLAKDIAVYYGMISYLDHSIGQLLDHLEAKGLRDDTLIVFTSDHGHVYGHHGLTAKGPFHYEDLIRVPMIASWPGKIPQGTESPAIQSLVDLPVTFLSAAGLQVPRSMQGVNQLAVWQKERAFERDHATIEFRQQATAIHMKTYVDARYKITVYYNQPYGELFDLEKDPEEINNLWAAPSSAELKATLIQKLLFAEMGNEPLWMPRISSA